MKEKFEEINQKKLVDYLLKEIDMFISEISWKKIHNIKLSYTDRIQLVNYLDILNKLKKGGLIV